MTAKSDPDGPVIERNGNATEGEQQPLNMASTTVKTEDRGHPERKRRLSNESLDVSHHTQETCKILDLIGDLTVRLQWNTV